MSILAESRSSFLFFSPEQPNPEPETGPYTIERLQELHDDARSKFCTGLHPQSASIVRKRIPCETEDCMANADIELNLREPDARINLCRGHLFEVINRR